MSFTVMARFTWLVNPAVSVNPRVCYDLTCQFWRRINSVISVLLCEGHSSRVSGVQQSERLERRGVFPTIRSLSQ